MVRGVPVRECGPPDRLVAAQSKDETNKRKREEEERQESLAVKREVAAIDRKHHEQMYPCITSRCIISLGYRRGL